MPYLPAPERDTRLLTARAQAQQAGPRVVRAYARRVAVPPRRAPERRAARLRAQIDEHAARLAEAQYAFFREESGLDALFTALAPLLSTSTSSTSPSTESTHDAPVAQRMRSLGLLRPEALAAAAQALDDFLPSAVMDAMENVQHVQDAALARAVTEEAAARFCADFERVEELLVRADEEEEMAAAIDAAPPAFRSLFPRTTGEIRVLLS